ncbi:hypothetical protein B296_00001081 [Ensete ventricosum]|uniref:Uncharacterized protein n=1 Tax=Ensete ventricosum TaxID=4639 RepID=A0A427AVP1_ENSVE|nr:hypothetical protein B296_00001081 [Ensete ventricosum]
MSSSRPKGTNEKQIDVINNGPTLGGNSSSARKAYARSTIEKRLSDDCDPEITFGSGNEEYLDHDDAVVISARITNTCVDPGRSQRAGDQSHRSEEELLRHRTDYIGTTNSRATMGEPAYAKGTQPC